MDSDSHVFFAEKKDEKTIKKNTSLPQISQQHGAQRRGSATISLHSWQVSAASRGDWRSA